MLLLVLFALSLFATPPSAAEAGPLITGVTNIDSRAPLAFLQTRNTGAQSIRIPLYWGGTAPERLPANWDPANPNDPNYRWGKSDTDVARAVEAGLTPVLQVDGAPEWTQRCTSPSVLDGPALCDPDPAALGAFATAAARRYNGQTPGVPRVRYWQGLNEPNLSIFFFPQYDTLGKPLSPYLYRDLLNAFYAGVKSVDKSNLVLAAGLAPIAVPPWTIGPMRFARIMLCMRGTQRPRPTRGNCGGGVHFDIFAIQPYTTGAPTHEGGVNDVQMGDLQKLQRLLRAADRAGRIKTTFKRTPLWITEFSWDTKPPDPGGLAMSIATRWTAEALYQAWKAGVAHFFWYSLRDDAHDPNRAYSETLESGLYFRGATLEQDKPKPLMRAFRFPFVGYPSKNRLSFWGRTPNSRGGRVAIQVRRKSGWSRLLVTRAGKQGIFRGKLRSRYGRNKRGAVRAVYHGQASPAFSMRPVKDFRQPPFG